jgi:hypothetical protein
MEGTLRFDLFNLISKLSVEYFFLIEEELDEMLQYLRSGNKQQKLDTLRKLRYFLLFDG